MPDVDVTSPRHGRFWAEIKFKTKADFTYLTQQEEHGIAIKSFRHYRLIADRTKAPVWLFICEGNTGLLLYQDCAVLAPHARISNTTKMDPGGMVFWPRSAFVIDTDIPDPPTSSPDEDSQPRLQGNLWSRR